MKRYHLFAIGLGLLAATASAQTDGFLFYAGGVTADARTTATGLGVLDGAGTNPNTDAMVPTVYVADVSIGAGTVTVDNWRSAADYDLGNPIPLDNPATGGTTENYSWIYLSHNVHQYNGHLYVGPGDWNSDNNFDTADIVVHAPINTTTGALGSWTFGPQIPTALAINASAIVEVGGTGYLYVFGSVSEATCYYSEIQPDGTLGAWQTGNALPSGADWFHGGTSVGDKLIYASGNLVGTPPQSHYSTISAGGGMGAWTSIGDFTVGDEAAARWAYAMGTVTAPGGNPRLIATAGNGVATDDGVYTSEVVAGVPGAWVKQAAAVPVPVRNVTGIGVEDVFFVVGGATSNTAGASVNNVRVGRMDAGGVVTWVDDTDPSVFALPETRSYGGLAFVESVPPSSAAGWEMYD